MRKPWNGLMIAAAMAVACGGNGNGGDAGNPGSPVASTPLTGVIQGRTFTPVGAVAVVDTFSDAGMRFLSVYEVAANCSNTNPQIQQGQGAILGYIAWKTGLTYNLDFTHSITLVYPDDAGTPQNDIAISGRVEEIDAPPDAGAMGTLRIRANFDAQNNVEGQVSVMACDF